MKDRIRKLFTNVWNIPNVLTMIRLVLIPVFVAVFFSTPHDHDKIAALAVFAAVLFSDLASISSGSRNIGQLQHTIGSLEDTNSRLRTQVSYYQNWSHEVAASNDDTVFRTVEISLPEN